MFLYLFRDIPLTGAVIYGILFILLNVPKFAGELYDYRMYFGIVLIFDIGYTYYVEQNGNRLEDYDTDQSEHFTDMPSDFDISLFVGN
jgi:hypothetical protein